MTRSFAYALAAALAATPASMASAELLTTELKPSAEVMTVFVDEIIERRDVRPFIDQFALTHYDVLFSDADGTHLALSCFTHVDLDLDLANERETVETLVADEMSCRLLLGVEEASPRTFVQETGYAVNIAWD